MLKETNLEAVKDVARCFARLDIQINEKVGFIVNHPFIETVTTAVQKDGKLILKDVRNAKDLEDVRENIIKTIDEVTSYQQFLVLIRAPYLPAFFKFTHHLLSSYDYASFLSSMWTMMEFPNIDENIPPKDFVKHFRKAEKVHLMAQDEYEQYLSLPDEITIYRGVRRRGKIRALSWTTDVKRAEWFASRWGAGGIVYRTKVKREDVLAVFNSRGESELVVDCSKLEKFFVEKTMVKRQTDQKGN